ncbi:hypothetical protein LDG_9008 [Legionella drancourtii LLAP12]|uniref:Uncharacterized protein n=1 Tax=Legionella drancourtii LLAP12 TaxID=658187 RepID=G9EUL0_9GAMM|nr:hypothetical protein LDG_9008 [Legionella drancourtii LLAP12]
MLASKTIRAKEAFMPSRRLRDSAKTFPQPERIEVLTK